MSHSRAVMEPNSSNDTHSLPPSAAEPPRMTPAEVAAALEEAARFGVDLAALRHNLTLTPSQRLAMLQAALRTWRKLRNAKPL